MTYTAPKYLASFAGILLARSRRTCSNCNREGGASRRLIESFSLSRTKDAPPAPSPFAIGAQIRIYYMCTIVLSAVWALPSSPRSTSLTLFEYAIVHVIFGIFRFSAFPSASSSLDTNSFLATSLLRLYENFHSRGANYEWWMRDWAPPIALRTVDGLFSAPFLLKFAAVNFISSFSSQSPSPFGYLI